jgi:hypothetical protein
MQYGAVIVRRAWSLVILFVTVAQWIDVDSSLLGHAVDELTRAWLFRAMRVPRSAEDITDALDFLSS